MTSDAGIMNTVVFDVASLESALDDFAQAWQDSTPKQPRISFASAELMFKTLGGRRLELLQHMGGKGALGIRELARLAARDVRSVHADTRVLLRAGVLSHAEDGKVEFPFEAIHVDFELRVA